MFEKTFKPFVKASILHSDLLQDPIDICISRAIAEAVEVALPDVDVEVLHDFEVDARRRPKVLVQTAAHVAGAAYYYQPKDIASDVVAASTVKLTVGLCVHPRYGGWFAIRALVILKNRAAPNLVQVTPLDVVPLQQDRLRLLEAYSTNWRDWKYRDVIPAEDRYSEHQILYFSTTPKDRIPLLKQLIDDGSW